MQSFDMFTEEKDFFKKKKQQLETQLELSTESCLLDFNTQG